MTHQIRKTEIFANEMTEDLPFFETPLRQLSLFLYLCPICSAHLPFHSFHSCVTPVFLAPLSSSPNPLPFLRLARDLLFSAGCNARSLIKLHFVISPHLRQNRVQQK